MAPGFRLVSANQFSRSLSLLVRRTTGGDLAKSWTQRIIVDGRARNLGLGTWPHVSLAEAREKCVLNLVARRRGDLVLAGRQRSVPTFGEAVDRVIAIHAAGWRDGGRSERQWRASLRDYAMWRLGEMPVNRIGTADVMAVLLPIWAEKRETARRVRQRISPMMRWAVAQGYREDNPGGDAIGAALPKTGVRTRHQPAREARSLVDGSDLVFPSVRGRALSDATLSKMVRDLGIGAVPHGFRSSFRDWAAECSDAPREVCELALAHVDTDRVEAAYRRTDLFERRRELMEEWSAFLGDHTPV